MSIQTLVLLFAAAGLVLALMVTLGAAFFTVEQRTTVILQRLGRFLREAGPGLHVKVPFIDKVVGRINLRVQQQAIVAGLRDSLDEFRKSVPGTTAKDVMNLVLMTQYFDRLKEIGASSRTNAILIPHSPGNLSSLTEQMRTAMIEADQIVRSREPRARPAGTGVCHRHWTPLASAPGRQRQASTTVATGFGH
jgi:hypothetical protein